MMCQIIAKKWEICKGKPRLFQTNLRERDAVRAIRKENAEGRVRSGPGAKKYNERQEGALLGICKTDGLRYTNNETYSPKRQEVSLCVMAILTTSTGNT